MSNSSFWLYQKYQIIGNQDPIPVIPLTYSVSGDTLDPQPLVEKLENDPKCGYVPPVEYQYRDIESGYTCVDLDKYTKIVSQRSSDGIHWENVSYSAGTLIQQNSSDCGYIGTIYRLKASGTTCYQGDKYMQMVEQVSNDNIHWTNTGRVERGYLIESGSSDCIEYRWTNIPITDDYICDECPDFSELYLTFIPTSGSSTFKFNPTDSATTVYYSLDSGSTWTALASNVYTPSVAEGQKIMWKSTAQIYNGIGRFSSTGQFEAEGNVMSLLYGDNFVGQIDLTGKDNAFNSLFNRCTTITSAEYLVLPATTLAYQCYADMFGECISLTTAPSILPATTLSDGCYASMFYDCTSLTTAPKLPATTLSFYCYSSMFQNCTSLVTAPELPAPTLEEWCYYSMFQGCTNLNNITCLATDISASNCTTNWVYKVSSTGTFTKAASMSDWPINYSGNGIPSNWTIQNV